MRVPDPLLALSWLQTWHDYFIEVESNTFLHLSVVLALLFGLFMYRLVRQQRILRQARLSMPLVIGGWGTRGKSGTERCKAALFHAYGAEVFCKTTGCEAMFIHAPPNQPAEELFLFRPLDKVSIWEQMTVLTTAARLNSQVFLYECMALNPRYVNVLQHGWMKDDVSTLTNAYPDHEDIQGPAGFNVAEVIGNFVPHHTVCWTAEQQMLPILNRKARERHTELVAHPWLDAAMITDDLLDRFPYREHPNNLAMVEGMGRHLGVSSDFIFKEVADWLVPDLGVLRTYPTVRYRGRAVYFSNGMSANERRGTLDNWRRLGFYDHNTRDQPTEWVIGVVNNRADRIPRSKVFAGIIVNDIAAHRFFFVGSNLKGMLGYIEESMEANQEQWDLLREPGPQAVRGKLERDLEQMKFTCRRPGDLERVMPTMLGGCGFDEEAAKALLDSTEWKALSAAAERIAGQAAERQEDALESAWQEAGKAFVAKLESAWEQTAQETREEHDRTKPDDLIPFLRTYWKRMKSALSMQQQIEAALQGGGLSAQINREYIAFMRQALRSRLVVIWDYYATGDQIIRRILEEVPPGHTAHLCGLQNIKGTGLDFAYRWVDLMKIQQYADKLTAPQPEARAAAVTSLAFYSGYHYWDGLLALAALKQALRTPLYEDAKSRQSAEQAIERVREGIAAAKAKMAGGQQKGAWYDPLLGVIEPVLDVYDSIYRRRTYDRLIEDIVHLRISHPRAAEELRDLVERQKGGWLKKAMRKKTGV
ncbi:MAG: hypothetical protein HS116_20205 [Planctomycetes bacterium]|nr:hypothetical protein [Planctomycetota bacterium]